MSHMPQYGAATATNNAHIIGMYLYTATGVEAQPFFTMTHGLGLTAPYYVICSPQGAHDVPVIDPNPIGGAQTPTACSVAISGPLTAGDKFLFIFYNIV